MPTRPLPTEGSERIEEGGHDRGFWRAALGEELAAAVGRPRSSMAHHVTLLADAELLRVVSTAMVRGEQQRFYGRVTLVLDLVDEYGRLPRTSNGTAAYGILTAMYPTEHSRLGPRTRPSADQV